MNTNTKNTPDALAKRVIGRIDEEHLSPRPRWEFILKNYTLWGLGVLAVLFGALAFSATLFEVQTADWQYSSVTHSDALSFFLETAPFFWVLALGLFILLGYVYVRRTNHGYRYPLIAVLSGACVLSVILGTGIFAAGFGGEVEESIGDHPGFYRPIMAQERSWWSAPEKGFLSGEVATSTPIIASSSSLTLRDLNGKLWAVDIADLRQRDLSALSQRGPVRIVGAPATSTDKRFHACFILSWNRMGARPVIGGRPPQAPPVFMNARNEEKSAECKNIRPYKQLRTIQENETSE